MGSDRDVGPKMRYGESITCSKAGRTWIVDADLKGYFDSIPQNKLMEALAGKISDGAILELIQRFLKQGVMESAQEWKPTEQGTPQGAVISPLLANIYLDPFDHLMAEGGWAQPEKCVWRPGQLDTRTNASH